MANKTPKIPKPVKIKYNKISKSKGKNFCDELWSILVKIRDGNQCVICSSETMINSHHMVSRRIFKTRFLISNGISLCPGCHKYNLSISAHTCWWNFDEWVKNNRPEQYAIWLENRKIQADGEPTDYEKIYEELEKQHKQMTGNYFRIERVSQYLLSKNIDTIKEKLKNNESIQNICDSLNFPVSVQKLKEFINLNKKYIES